MLYHKFSVLAICTFCIACCQAGITSVRDVGRPMNATALAPATTSVPGDANASAILECISCLNKQPRLQELIRMQKVAQRLEYIKKQLHSNLPVDKPPKDPPKLGMLPNFVVDQLINSPQEEEDEEEVREGDQKQMVLFPEQETSNCHPSIRNGVCITFKFGEDVTLNSINEAVVWLSSEKLASKWRTQNFTVIDGSVLYMKALDLNAHSRVQEIEESDGWYGVDVKDYLSSWERKSNNSENTFIKFVIECDGCELLATPTPANKTGSQVSSFMFLRATKNVHSRVKRGASCEYAGDECCRDNLEVDFSSLGGSFRMVVYPVKFNAYMCRGNCYFYSSIYAEKTYATMLEVLKANKTAVQGLRLPTTCCTPAKLSGLSVIYATSDTSFHKATIPNMVVDSCGCI